MYVSHLRFFLWFLGLTLLKPRILGATLSYNAALA